MNTLIMAVVLICSGPQPAEFPNPKKPVVRTPQALCRRYNLRSRYCGNNMSIPRFSLVARAMAGHFSTRYGSSAPLAGKLRKSAFVPNISMEYGRWDDMDISWSSRPGENLYQDEVVGTRQFFRVKLTWDARLLLFDPNDIILLREKRKETLLRESYDDRGRRMFFKWKRELLLFRRRPTLGRLLYLEELEAALDALSGAAFSRLCRGNVHGRFR